MLKLENNLLAEGIIVTTDTLKRALQFKVREKH